MGYSSWSEDKFRSYSNTVRHREIDTSGRTVGTYTAQEVFKSTTLDPALDPKNVIRECCDSEQHPETIPVILGVDETGSMGHVAVEVANQFNVIMKKLYKELPDVQFMVMGIGDLQYDRHPMQVTQFEPDIRICEQVDKIYFEGNGGGNNYESYSEAWYFGLHHTKLDCWKRGKKGIIITTGDELLNPYLPLEGYSSGLRKVTGDNLQADIETADLYAEASKKFDIYHVHVEHGSFSRNRTPDVKDTWGKYLDEDHLKIINNVDDVIDTIVRMVFHAVQGSNVMITDTTTNEDDNIEVSNTLPNVNENGEITWPN